MAAPSPAQTPARPRCRPACGRAGRGHGLENESLDAADLLRGPSLIRRFVFASSCSNYGAAGDQFLTEDAEFNPVTPYGESKVHVELAVTLRNIFQRRARNRGLAAATGELIAYIDDDARPDDSVPE